MLARFGRPCKKIPNEEHNVNLVDPVTKPLLRRVCTLFVIALLPFIASAQSENRTLRIQTHFGPESATGKLITQFIDDVHTMSSGQLVIDLHFSSSVVRPHETFAAAASGILDGDMTGPGYQITKDPAFQFIANTLGAYETPLQQHAWFYQGGEELVQKLYNKFGMELIGWWSSGRESLSSSTPLSSINDLKNWTFRSPPGLQTDLFKRLGAKPEIMDVADIFSALKNKEIDGADASGLANNVSLGLYEITPHATYPGFHSMPAEHLAINKSKWDALPEHLQRIVHVAMEKLSFHAAVKFSTKNQQAAAQLAKTGVTLHNWSRKDRMSFRNAMQKSWLEFAQGSAAAQAFVESHQTFMQSLGLIEPP